MPTLHLLIPPTNRGLRGHDTDARMLAIAASGEPALVLGDSRGQRYAESLGVTALATAPLFAGSVSSGLVAVRRAVRQIGATQIAVGGSLGNATRRACAAVGGRPVVTDHPPSWDNTAEWPWGSSREEMRSLLGVRPHELLLIPALEPASSLMARRLVFMTCLLRVAGVPARAVVPEFCRALPESIAFSAAAEQARPIVTASPLPTLYLAADAVVFDWSLDALAAGPRQPSADELALGKLAGNRFCRAEDSPERTPTANSRLPLLTAAVLRMVAGSDRPEAFA